MGGVIFLQYYGKKNFIVLIGLKDLRAVGTNESRSFLRKAVNDWIIKYNKWSLREWRSDIIGKTTVFIIR